MFASRSGAACSFRAKQKQSTCTNPCELLNGGYTKIAMLIDWDGNASHANAMKWSEHLRAPAHNTSCRDLQRGSKFVKFIDFHGTSERLSRHARRRILERGCRTPTHLEDESEFDVDKTELCICVGFCLTGEVVLAHRNYYICGDILFMLLSFTKG